MFSLTSFILAFGYLGVCIALFAESGFFLGFFLPGDSLLFAVGLLASRGHLNLAILIPLAIISAVAGDSLGYWTGVAFGRNFLERHTNRFLKRQYLEDTEKFFAKYGAMAVFFARFVPIVRTFTPIFAGIGEMRYGTFFLYNIAGGALWTGGLLIIAYYLGQIPGVSHYVTIIIVLIIIVSLLPIAFGAVRAYRRKKKLLKSSSDGQQSL